MGWLVFLAQLGASMGSPCKAPSRHTLSARWLGHHRQAGTPYCRIHTWNPYRRLSPPLLSTARRSGSGMAGECWSRLHPLGAGSLITVRIRVRSDPPCVFFGMSGTLRRSPLRPVMVSSQGGRQPLLALAVVRAQCDDLRRLDEIVLRPVGGCPLALQRRKVRA